MCSAGDTGSPGLLHSSYSLATRNSLAPPCTPAMMYLPYHRIESNQLTADYTSTAVGVINLSIHCLFQMFVTEMER